MYTMATDGPKIPLRPIVPQAREEKIRLLEKLDEESRNMLISSLHVESITD
jgi:hypothetical protein